MVENNMHLHEGQTHVQSNYSRTQRFPDLRAALKTRLVPLADTFYQDAYVRKGKTVEWSVDLNITIPSISPVELEDTHRQLRFFPHFRMLKCLRDIENLLDKPGDPYRETSFRMVSATNTFDQWLGPNSEISFCGSQDFFRDGFLIQVFLEGNESSTRPMEIESWGQIILWRTEGDPVTLASDRQPRISPLRAPSDAAMKTHFLGYTRQVVPGTVFNKITGSFQIFEQQLKMEKVVENLCLTFQPTEKDRQEVEKSVKTIQNPDDGKIEIRTNSRSFFVQEKLLSDLSPVFASCFSHSNFRESQNRVYSMEAFQEEQVLDLLMFFHTGFAPRITQNPAELAALAHQYEVHDLLSQCDVLLIKECLAPETTFQRFLELSKVAALYEMPLLLVVVQILSAEGFGGSWNPEQQALWTELQVWDNNLLMGMMRAMAALMKDGSN